MIRIVHVENGTFTRDAVDFCVDAGYHLSSVGAVE